jgi:endonuclease/exonuclease/phosphatase family metal-dependent hydrolase
MTAFRPKVAARAMAGFLTLGVLLAPIALAQSGSAASSDPMWRKTTAPNVFYPLRASRTVKDLGTYSSRHRGTDLSAGCNAPVLASGPGTALVRTSPAWNGRYVVRVISNTSGLVTGYAYLSRASVVDGQIVQSGQQIGLVGRHPSTRRCSLYYTVYQNGQVQNPTVWMRYHVGSPPPVPRLFNAPGIRIASFNVLGASHTPRPGRYSTYPSRMARTVNLFSARNLDVVGVQEFQKPQKAYFLQQTGDTYGIFNWSNDRREDSENAIVWRKSTMELVSSSTYQIPYFGGNIRNVPVVLLRQKATGRTAYFLNVHNPADVRGPASRYRAQAIAIERAKIIELRATGRPVFITGDFNDRQEAFCPLTAGKLMISPNSVPSMTCAYPAQTSIDWIFAAGQARFSSFVRDKSTQANRLSDHPIVQTTAHLQD